MNKEQLIIILQSVLFTFEGAEEQEILRLNPDYNPELVQVGIKMFKFLQEKIK